MSKILERAFGPPLPADWSPTDPRLAQSAMAGYYWQVAALSVILYDHATTFDLEIELIWKRKWNSVQVLFFINRYVGGAVLLHGTAFQLWAKGDAFEFVRESGAMVQMIMSMIALWAMQGIIINRVWCMYRRSRKIFIVLVTSFLAEIVSSFIVVALNLYLEPMVLPLTSTQLSCIPTKDSPLFWIFWITIVAFDVLVFVLALYEGIRHWREKLRQRRVSQGAAGRVTSFAGSMLTVRHHSRFISVFLRDSILFPFIGLLGCIFNILAWFQVLPYESLSKTLVLSAVLSPLLGCRLVLNLRELYYQPFEEELRPRRDRDEAEDNDIGCQFVVPDLDITPLKSVPAENTVIPLSILRPSSGF